MAGLTPWDDCLSLVRGFANLAVFDAARTPLAAVAALGAVVIHSPVSDLQTMAGLMFTGGATWGPFALNVVALLVALWAVLFHAGRSPLSLFVAMALVLLYQPLTLEALTFIKADWKGGLLIAAGLYLLYVGAEKGRRGLTLWGSGLIGVGVAAKLTAIYMPVFAVAAVIGFEAVAFFGRSLPGDRLGRSFLAHLSHARPMLGPALALALGPYLAFFALGVAGHHGLIGYIAFALSDAWNDGRTTLGRALFYSPFATGGGAWGMLGWLTLIFSAAALVLSLRARLRLYPAALVVLILLAALLLAPLAAAHTSSWEFGAPLLGVALAATLIGIRVVGRALPRYGALAALVVVALFSLVTPLQPPFEDPDVGRPTAVELRQLKRTYGDITGVIAAQAPGPAPRVRVLYEDSFAPFPNLALLYRERMGELADVDRVDDLTRPEAPAALDRADFLLTAVPAGGAMRGLSRRFPTSADPAGTDRAIAADPRWVPVRAFPIEGGQFRLYQRRPATASHP